MIQSINLLQTTGLKINELFWFFKFQLIIIHNIVTQNAQ